MKVIFLGVGEAFDETQINNSHLIISKTKLLLDCGYSVPHQLWRFNEHKDFLDAIYITHRHADHYFGVPPLLVRMWEDKRKKPLTIFCQKGMKKVIEDVMEYGYIGLRKKFQFPFNIKEIEKKIKFKEFILEIAPTIHSVRNMAIRVSNGKKAICYSGDGMFGKETEKLYRNADLLIHESYFFKKSIPNHASITDVIKMAERNNIKCVALTHIQRKERENISKKIIHSKVKVLIPKPMDKYSF